MIASSPTSAQLGSHSVRYALRAPRGEATGTPLVLLHGGAVDHRMWEPQLEAFPDRLVLAPDARGHGGTSDAEEAYRLTDDVVELLDALGVGRAVLVGVSMGGGIAVDTALEHPDRVAGLVVSGTGTSEPDFADSWTLETLAAWRRAEEQADLEGWIAAFLRFTHGPGRDRAEVDPQVWDLVETMARETLAGHLRVGADGIPLPPVPPTPVTETWERAAGISVPVLALPGALDGEDHRRLGRRLAEVVPDADHEEVPGGAHYPNLENPAGFNAAVTGFLRRHDL
ncbi:alpha/beta fold hydrolase [Serinicoccus kebangsaanensis]|uniref:alpha/beta fold hydrolase n=1 Tax=Serinicoccus kebangsaanensis TaxID=2602069 RepID=UPI00124EB70C|nr:alpha/beta hydrolase [Serinicoccus kebangsaanensis]